MPKRIGPDELASVLPPGGLTIVSACSAESGVLADAIEIAGEALSDMSFTGIFVPGLNRRTWRAGAGSRVLTFFQTPELRREGERVTFLPLCYQDIGTELKRLRPTAILFMCSPPDLDGRCSFGTEVSFMADLWTEIPIRVAHVNPRMPATPGDAGIPFDEITAVIEADQSLLGTAPVGDDPAAIAIGRHVASFVRDGATLQTGLGKVPDMVLRALAGHRNLSAHTGLMGDGLLELIESGAITRQQGATVGVAIGSERLYRSLDHPALDFRPPSVTHAPEVLARIADLVSVNSALEVDLFGQAYAELQPSGLLSGPGGASDYARGARGHGLRIVALPADAARGEVSRIVPAGRGAGPVSLGRMDVDIVVTEHGAADLRGLDHEGRARSLIAIAAENHREALAAGWSEYSRRF